MAIRSLKVSSPSLDLATYQDQLQSEGYLIIEGLAPDITRAAYQELLPHIRNALRM